ncbi:HD-GYP domain-containing protein [Azotosporobacter soli]|uniref:HD-GYP domain-containing protein n=1 Tax=Azotosporobacter soli TaxID=3055040 RepID=UPI0031FE7B3E
MQRKHQRKLLKNLFAAWLILSSIIGSVVYYLEMEQIDEWVVSLALAESEKLVESSIHEGTLQQQVKALLHEKMTEMTQRNFLIAELYDQEGNKYLEAVRPGSQSIEERLKEKGHAATVSRNIWYEKQQIPEGLFLQVFVPLINHGGEYVGHFEGVYHVDEAVVGKIKKQVVWSLFLVVMIVLGTTLAMYPIFLALNRDLIQYSRGLLRANLEVLDVLGGAIAKRDSDTHAHNYRVTIYAIYLAERLQVPASQVIEWIKGAFLHDVGKIAISDTILLKNGKLSEEEFSVMKTHTQHGVDIIKRSSWLNAAKEIVCYHHEKYDGSGYLDGLRGDDIPLGARVFAIVDVFDALTSQRPYKKAFSLEKTLEIMREGEGTHFDPLLLQVFLTIAQELHEKFSAANETELEEELALLIKRYF